MATAILLNDKKLSIAHEQNDFIEFCKVEDLKDIAEYFGCGLGDLSVNTLWYDYHRIVGNGKLYLCVFPIVNILEDTSHDVTFRLYDYDNLLLAQIRGSAFILNYQMVTSEIIELEETKSLNQALRFIDSRLGRCHVIAIRDPKIEIGVSRKGTRETK